MQCILGNSSSPQPHQEDDVVLTVTIDLDDADAIRPRMCTEIIPLEYVPAGGS